jgi:hypothetical protein
MIPFLKKHPYLIRPFVVGLLPLWPFALGYVTLQEEGYWANLKEGYAELLKSLREGKLP